MSFITVVVYILFVFVYKYEVIQSFTGAMVARSTPNAEAPGSSPG